MNKLFRILFPNKYKDLVCYEQDLKQLRYQIDILKFDKENQTYLIEDLRKELNEAVNDKEEYLSNLNDLTEQYLRLNEDNTKLNTQLTTALKKLEHIREFVNTI